jgi:hypothetical protein
LSLKTGKTFAEAIQMLAEHGAEIPIDFVTVTLCPDSDASVHLVEVEKVLARVSMALRDQKGLLHRLDENERAEKVHASYTDCLELWSAVQALSEKTFFTREGLASMRRLYQRVVLLQQSAYDAAFDLRNDKARQAYCDEQWFDLQRIATALEHLGAGTKEDL